MASSPTYETRFVVTGTPIPYARARTVRLPDGSTRYFVDKRSGKYRKRVAGEALSASRWMRDGGALVRRSPPWAAASKCLKVAAKRSARRNGKRLPNCSCPWCSAQYRLRLLIVLPDKRTRDEDNIEKNILDACTGILWWDDRQALVEAKERAYSKANPRVEVEIRLVTEQTEIEAVDKAPLPEDCALWEMERAKEWLDVWAKAGRKPGRDEAQLSSLAALLRDCWASGFLEAMDADTDDKSKRGLDANVLHGRSVGTVASPPSLRLVKPPEEPEP